MFVILHDLAASLMNHAHRQQAISDVLHETPANDSAVDTINFQCWLDDANQVYAHVFDHFAVSYMTVINAVRHADVETRCQMKS